MTMHATTNPAPPPNRKREKGIALLMTLGVLSLLIVLAFSFAIAAINSQVAAKLDEGLLKARLQAESSLQLVYTQLGRDFAVKSDPGNLFPATALGKGATAGPTGTPFEGRYYWYSTNTDDTHGINQALHVNIGGIDYLPYGFDAVDPDVGWIHILHSETKDRIVARYAFVIIDESGKIDPSAAVSLTVPEGAETNRLGNDASDINLLNVLDDSQLVQQLQRQAMGGSLPDNLRWLSYYHIFRGTEAAAASDANVRQVLNNLFPHSYDIESYHDSPLDMHRFNLNLTQEQWDEVTIADIDAPGDVYWLPDGSTPAPNNGGIPWLHFGDAAKKYQIIANLIDYFDSDSIPTTDYVNDPVPLATYVGLEEVPFINEFVITMSIAGNPDNPGQFDWHTDLQVELINMWPVDFPMENTSLTVAITVDYSVDDTPESVQYVYTFTPTDPEYSEFVANAHAYYTYESKAMGAVTDIGARDEVEIIDMVINYAVLKNPDGDCLDFVGPSSRIAEFGAAMRLNILENFKSINYEVNDPRYNLAADGWAWSNGWGSGFGGTLGVRNAFCNPAPHSDPNEDGILDKDHEPNAIEPWDVSTAFIRNAPMHSIWELGTIHRDAPWETINLKHSAASGRSSSGLAAYVDGDANILDQVKMGDRLREVGRTNINTYNQRVLTGLFAGIPISSHYDAARSSDSTLSYAAASNIAAQIVQRNNQQHGGSPFTARSQIADIPGLLYQFDAPQDGEFYPSDAAMESTLGKVAPLITIRQNYFTVILTVQIIQDVGAVPLTGNEATLINGVAAQLKRFDPGADRILAQQRIKAIIFRDALNATHYRLERYEYIE